MSMVEWAVAMAETRRGGNRALHILAGALDRCLDSEPLRETGGNRRSKRAAGAVGVPAVDARAVPDALTVGGREHVIDRVARQMPAFQQDRTATQLAQFCRRPAHGREIGDGVTGEDLDRKSVV